MHISALRSTTATKITFKQFTFQFEEDENGNISSIYAYSSTHLQGMAERARVPFKIQVLFHVI